MKRILKTAVLLFTVSFLLQLFLVYAAPDEYSTGDPMSLGAPTADVHRKREMRGLWVASVVNIDYPSKPVTDPEQLKSEAINILDHAEYVGLNAVFLQVRPTSDAFYRSEIFPWSKYLTGTQGLAPEGGFDPLQFWITEAHNRGIELHAWINPYRVTKKTSKEKSHDFASLDASNPARVNPEWVVKHSDGNLYYDPGLPEVRKLVFDGVLEIVENYDVDGIHFDDYFYPGRDFKDGETFKKYGKGFSSIDDWRRENVNILIRDLYKALKTKSDRVEFGVSPFGIWANKESNSYGSDTRGAQSYYDHYADTRKWVKEGIIDYIAPQLYWHIGYSIADYEKLLHWWEDTVRDTGVDLYIGQAAYRSLNSESTSPWYGVAEIERQLKMNANSPETKGSIFFSCNSLTKNSSLSLAIKEFYGQKDGIEVAVKAIPVSVSKPSVDIKTSLSSYYLNGASDPAKPLYLNGKEVKDRSRNGYFGILVQLSAGNNTFTFSQEGSQVTRNIYRYTSGPVKMSKAEIPAASVFPQSQEYRAPGEKITLSCKAPRGSKVTVKIGGKSYEMKSSDKAVSDSGIYEGKYTYVYTIPTYDGTPRNIDIGAPVYTMNYKGTVKTIKAPAKLGVIMKGSPYYAKMDKEIVYSYNTADTSEGAAFELNKGMYDYVTGMTGSLVRLSSGQWVKKEDVEIYTSSSQSIPKIKNVKYKTGEKWDALELKMTAPAVTTASFDGALLKLNVAIVSSDIVPVIPEAALFSSVKAVKNNNGTEYILSLDKGQRIEGYYIEKTDDGVILWLKRPIKAGEGERPLEGITIMLDPGHGGTDPGAVGPLGENYAEKSINLNASFLLQEELQRLGATVLMTRTSDNNVSLEERLSASRNVKPDMFVSLHANSMADNVDISKIDGFSVFYRENLSKAISEKIYNKVTQELGRNLKGVHKKNFYVVRGTWAPSVLLESGFVPNPNEFEWLIDDYEQLRFVRTVAQAIKEYFSNGN